MNTHQTIAGRLTFPMDGRPAPGAVQAVADGILWVRMPLPFALNHINLWLLRDGAGWTLVDTGLGIEETRGHWETVFADHLGGLPIVRVVCTHLHPDHVGQAGWLCDRWDAPLVMTRTEYLMARVLVHDTGRPAPEEGVAFYRAAGFSAEALADYTRRFGSFGRVIAPMPDSYVRIVEGDVLTIGGEDWRVTVGSGHSPEHACLWNTHRKLFISGDQILPRISSIVSVWPTEPHADPLRDWLDSCARLQQLLPADTLILPAHGDPFTGVHLRLDQLIDEHTHKLDSLRAALDRPLRAVDTFTALFKRPVDRDSQVMATGEALAHLHWLMRRGEVSVRRDDDGIDWYVRET